MQTQDRMEISAVTESTDRNCMFIILGENLHQIRKVWLWTPDDVEIEDLEMENAKEVTVEITETEDGDVEQEEQDIIVIKTDGKWCLHPDETDF